MSEFFLKVVNMSISASWLVLAVLLLRLVLKKAPKWVSVLLWGLVAVRLICPFSIESALSLIPSAETVSPEIMMDWTPEISTGIASMDTVINPIITETFAPEPYASANPLQILIPVCGNLWVLGILVMLLYTAVSYLLMRRKVATAVRFRGNIYQSENVASPFVLGILRPRIYLPFRMDSKNSEHVIAHEQAHIRRKDHLWKPIGFLLLAIHWFNPFMWLGYILLCRDIELACDETVIKEMDCQQKADYTEALVACSINRRSIRACPLAFGEVGVKARVNSILHYKKPAFWIIVAAVVVCIAVAVCFLTDPQKQTDSNTLGETHPNSGQAKPLVSKLHTYYQNPDGTWQANGHTYQYRLEITGKLSEPSRESIFVVLSNTETVSFEQAQNAFFSGDLNLTDDAILVEWLHPIVNDLRDFEKPPDGNTGEKLTLDYILMLSEKKSKIHWEDFQNFAGYTAGSGFHIMRYNIDGHLYMLVGENGLSDGPAYAMLCCTHLRDAGFDIKSDHFKSLFSLIYQFEGAAEIFNGNLKTYYKMTDGTWRWEDHVYKYRLEITSPDTGSTFVYLSNLESISPMQASKAAGTSSSLEDYFLPEEAILVEWIIPISPKQIAGVVKATLELPRSWDSPRTVTEPETLRKIESILQRSEVLENGAGCLLTGQLTLTLANGATLTLTMSEDNCATWLYAGTYYQYGLEMPDGVTGNEELYDLFPGL